MKRPSTEWKLVLDYWSRNSQALYFLVRCLYESYSVSQEHKIKCLVHYFEKVCLDMPKGNVSFERKVLPLRNSQSHLVYPEPDFWSKSTVSLCPLEVCTSGTIEDQRIERKDPGPEQVGLG